MPPPPTPPGTPYAVVRRLLDDAARCPGCTAALTRSRCGACGLDLSGAPGQQLWALSRLASDALSRREGHLQAMRLQQSAREATRPGAHTASRVPYPSSHALAPGPRIDERARTVVSGSLLAAGLSVFLTSHGDLPGA